MPIPFISAAGAHEKWFVDAASLEPRAPEFYRGLNAWTIGALAAILGALALGRAAEARLVGTAWWGRGRQLRLSLRRQAIPAVAATMGVGLIWSAARGTLLAENYAAPPTALGAVALAVEGIVGAWLFLGWLLPLAAIVLGALYLSLFFMFPALEPVDYLHVAGAAAFLFCASGDRFSAAWFVGKKGLPMTGLPRFGYEALRLLTAATLAWLALGKWLHPELHLAMLDIYSSWNPFVLLRAVGFGWLSPEIYVFLLAAVELTFSLFLLTGTLKRPVALGLIPVFLISVMFLGPEELVGHLPIIGILFALAVAEDGRG